MIYNVCRHHRPIMGYSEMIDECRQRLEASDLEISGEEDLGASHHIRIEDIGTLRIYKGKKKTTVDYSQIPAHFRERVMGVIEPASKDRVLGIDESGKGDFFGPLVVAGVFVDDEKKLRPLGIKDSKKLKDDKILVIAKEIKKLCLVDVVKISNERYNRLYQDIGNLNRLLAWGHAKVIENSLAYIMPDYVISDKFASEDVLRSQLQERGKKIRLVQRVRAEENIAVAAASIIARAEFVLALQKLSFSYGMELPLGAGEKVLEAAKEFSRKFGKDELSKVCKMHFRTYQEA